MGCPATMTSCMIAQQIAQQQFHMPATCAPVPWALRCEQLRHQFPMITGFLSNLSLVTTRVTDALDACFEVLDIMTDVFLEEDSIQRYAQLFGTYLAFALGLDLDDWDPMPHEAAQFQAITDAFGSLCEKFNIPFSIRHSYDAHED